MGFRFRKSISFGGRGFGITRGTSGLRFSAGLPGTGLSFSRRIGAGRSGSRLGTLIIVIFVTGLISRACAMQNQESATNLPKSETSLRKRTTSQAGEMRDALERRARELEWQIRCKPTEYRDAQGLRYLKYAEPDCAGRSLN